MLKTLTRCPQIYVTGGAVMRSHAVEECDLGAIVADTDWNSAISGGPIDATEYMPTGSLSNRYFTFFELVSRES